MKFKVGDIVTCKHAFWSEALGVILGSDCGTIGNVLHVHWTFSSGVERPLRNTDSYHYEDTLTLIAPSSEEGVVHD